MCLFFLYASLILLLIRFLVTASLNPLFDTLNAIWAGYGEYDRTYSPDNFKKRIVENISIFKQSGNDFGAAKSFRLFKCLPSGIHIKIDLS